MRYIVCIAFIFFGNASFSQRPFGEQLQSARFEIVKTTVEFLATDTETFGEVKSASCIECEDYDDIENFIQENQLTGASALVREWKNTPLDSSYARGMIELENFREAVINKIAGTSRKRRQELPEYDVYVNKVDGIVAAVVGNRKADGSAGAITTGKEQADPSAPNAARGANNGASPLAGTLPVTGKSSQGLQSYISYGAAGLFALLAFYFYRRNVDLSQKNVQLESKNKELNDKIGAHEPKIRTLQSDISVVKEELQESRRQYELLQEKYKKEKDKKRAAPVTAPTPPSKAEATRPAVIPPPQSPTPVIRFARYADQGDGFSVADLLEKDDSETIFELTISSPTVATFKVASNESAQRYALSNVSYFLGKTCTYDSFPTDNNSIRTDTPGQLQLQGNKWLITNPAKISFN